MELGLNAKYATLSKDFEQSGPQFPSLRMRTVVPALLTLQGAVKIKQGL